eukprot:jgi/Mesen1/8164/ME000438S07261
MDSTIVLHATTSMTVAHVAHICRRTTASFHRLPRVTHLMTRIVSPAASRLPRDTGTGLGAECTRESIIPFRKSTFFAQNSSFLLRQARQSPHEGDLVSVRTLCQATEHSEAAARDVVGPNWVEESSTSSSSLSSVPRFPEESTESEGGGAQGPAASVSLSTDAQEAGPVDEGISYSSVSPSEFVEAPPAVAEHLLSPLRVDDVAGGESSFAERDSAAREHPWPEWVAFVKQLIAGKFVAEQQGNGAGLALDQVALFEDATAVKRAVRSFGRDRNDLFRYLSKEDLRVVAAWGCPEVERKVVNAAKRLRAHLAIAEAPA